MIIQKAVKGIPLKLFADNRAEDIKSLAEAARDEIFTNGIVCNWWRKVGSLPEAEVSLRLTERNLHWHQNNYADADPNRGGVPFGEETPFISVSAGSILRDDFQKKNVLHHAILTALTFATDSWTEAGVLIYCYVFILGKKAVGHRQFAEEIRELNIYTGYSPFQPEGEITAKIQIPVTQIERIEVWEKSDYEQDIELNSFNPKKKPSLSFDNPAYLNPEDYHNIRELL